MAATLVGTVALAAALGLTLTSCSPRNGAKSSASSSPSAQAAVSVDTIPARSAALPEEVPAVGTFQAITSVNITPRAPGLVVSVPVHTGQYVAQGSVIMQLDTSALEMTVRQDQADLEVAQSRLGLSPGQRLRSDREIPTMRKAHATVENARLSWERSRTLYRADLISQKDLQDDKRALLTAQADYQSQIDQVKTDKASVAFKQVQLQADRLKLRDATVRAPFSGYVASVGIDVGDWVSPGGNGGPNAYVTLLTLDPIYCEMQIGEANSQKIKIGQQVTLTTPAYPGRTFKGSVLRISPSLDPTTRTLKVLASIANPEKRLKPGLYGNAKVNLGITPGVVLVPQMAQTEQAGQTCVYVVEQTPAGAVARLRTMQRGRVAGRWIEAAQSRVKAGEMVVVGNLDRLSDGVPVTVSRKLEEAPAVLETDP